jgi:hypothetical protein
MGPPLYHLKFKYRGRRGTIANRSAVLDGVYEEVLLFEYWQ